ncbi:histidine phosphatase family protein [Vibrio kyushuensis]|uniref:histidine phosphatase family protein n=1 Tax=Vibrio kyushuensis TaxID=2910249 RepID=UPI003D0E3A81
MDSTYNIYLLRHGKTEGPAALNGITDVQVSDVVQSNIAELLSAERLGFKTIVTSPLSRCRDLAERITSRDSSIEFAVEPRFQEMNFGDFDGKTFDELQPQWNVLDSFWKDPANHSLPNAESLQGCYSRVSGAWDEVVSELNQDTLIICHGGTIRLILAHVLNVDWSNPSWYSTLNIANQSITHIKILKSHQSAPHVQVIGKPLF